MRFTTFNASGGNFQGPRAVAREMLFPAPHATQAAVAPVAGVPKRWQRWHCAGPLLLLHFLSLFILRAGSEAHALAEWTCIWSVAQSGSFSTTSGGNRGLEGRGAEAAAVAACEGVVVVGSVEAGAVVLNSGARSVLEGGVALVARAGLRLRGRGPPQPLMLSRLC